jgi:Arc/MetJ family transcription regulator
MAALVSPFCVWIKRYSLRPKRNLFNSCINVYDKDNRYTWEAGMRTNVVVDDDLMESALKVSDLRTKRAAIEEGLKLLVQVKSQEKIKGLRGKLKWSGSLDEMRSDK